MNTSRGKHICNQLRAVRQRIADENGIALDTRECTHQGPCRGTCPRCEAEMRYLENALARRLRMGKAATVAGLGLTLAACGGGSPTSAEGPSSPLVTTDTFLEEPEEMVAPITPSSSPHPKPSPRTEAAPEDDEDMIEGEVSIPDYIVTGDACSDLPPLVDGMVDVEAPEEGEAPIYFRTEEDPEFPGGVDSLYAWLRANVKYPDEARNHEISGRVFVSFVVEVDGSISNPRVLRDIGRGCGAEAIRAVRQMPHWKPGKMGGVPVRTQFNLPIAFTLTDE